MSGTKDSRQESISFGADVLSAALAAQDAAVAACGHSAGPVGGTPLIFALPCNPTRLFFHPR
jgi:hypothetical protein